MISFAICPNSFFKEPSSSTISSDFLFTKLKNDNKPFLKSSKDFTILFEIYIGNGDELDINHIYDVLNAKVEEDDEDEIEDDDYCSITDIENEGDDE